MLKVQPSPHQLQKFLQSHSKSKQNDYFLIQSKQLKTVQQLINEIVFTTFQKSQSFLIILLRKVFIQLINHKLSVVLLQEIFQLVKQYETQIQLYKQHYSHIQNIMFEKQNHSLQLQHQLPQHINSQIDYSMMINIPQKQSPQQLQQQQDDNIYLSPSNQRNSKPLIVDIQCYSQDSKHNFMARYDDKYFCSQYLTTSQDQRQYTSKSNVIKQLKQQMQNKLKIQPHVSAFSFRLKQKNMTIDFQQQLLEWKRTKHSIVQQCSLLGALAPQDFDQNNFVEKIKQNHYRQKIKSAIVKRRLSAKHLAS